MFHVDLNWLLTGEGEMFLPSQDEQKAVARPSLDALVATKEELAELDSRLRGNEGKLAENDGKLAENDRRVAELEGELEDTKRQLQELRSIVYREHNITEEDELAEPELPYITDVAAGPLRETIPDGIYKIPKSMIYLLRGRFSEYFAAQVNGDSMKELIPNSSVVLMRECFAPKKGKIYLFRIDNEFSLKEFGYDPETGRPYVAYRDGSGERIYPQKGQICYCVAEFVAVLQEGEGA